MLLLLCLYLCLLKPFIIFVYMNSPPFRYIKHNYMLLLDCCKVCTDLKKMKNPAYIANPLTTRKILFAACNTLLYVFYHVCVLQNFRE